MPERAASVTGQLVSIEGSDVRFTCAEGDTLLRAALRAGVGLPYECNSGSCGTCRYQLVSGRVRDRWPDAPGLTARDRRRERRLACQSEPASACTLRVGDAGGRVPHRPVRSGARLADVRHLTHDMAEFAFVTDRPALFRPGQYAMLDLPGVRGERAYSMCNVGNVDGEWRFIVKRVRGGAATAALFDTLAPGDRVVIDGPYGHAFLREDDRRIVCVGGGSGLGPMLSIVTGLAALPAPETRSAHLFYGCRDERDLYRPPVLDTLRTRLGGLAVTAAFSEPTTTPAAPIRAGFVHEALADALDRDRGLRGCTFYAAGPPVMTDALARMLVLESGVPADRLSYDRFF